jgi:hypothetical protein
MNALNNIIAVISRTRFLSITVLFFSTIALLPADSFCFQTTLQTQQSQPPKLFTLERTFGGEELPIEYRLDSRQYTISGEIYLAVNKIGDVYVYDNRNIKVYDKSGAIKALLNYSLKGKSWGLTWNVQPILISSKGYLTTQYNGAGMIFLPDNTLLKDWRLDGTPVAELFFFVGQQLHRGNTFSLYAFNENELIYVGHTMTEDNPNETYYNRIIYENNGKLKEVAQYELFDMACHKERGAGFSQSSQEELGELHFALLPDDRILYCHTYYDVTYFENKSASGGKDNTGYCVFHISNPDGSDERRLTYTFTPIPFTRLNLKQAIASYGRADKADKKLRKRLELLKYFKPFEEMFVDGEYIFLITESYYVKKPVGVVLKTEMQETSVMSIEYEFIPALIHDGFAYRINTSNPQPFVEKYRINPIVYGK